LLILGRTGSSFQVGLFAHLFLARVAEDCCYHEESCPIAHRPSLIVLGRAGRTFRSGSRIGCPPLVPAGVTRMLAQRSPPWLHRACTSFKVDSHSPNVLGRPRSSRLLVRPITPHQIRCRVADGCTKLRDSAEVRLALRDASGHVS
jgi:hypothetical protein